MSDFWRAIQAASGHSDSVKSDHHDFQIAIEKNPLWRRNREEQFI